MNYFCKAVLDSGMKQQEVFLVLPENENVIDSQSNDRHELTKEFLIEQHCYKDFVRQSRAKLTMVDYVLYSTEKEVHANYQPEQFQELIDNQDATLVTRGELQIEVSEKKDKKGVVRKKKKANPVIVLLCVGGAAIFAVVAFGMGNMLGRSRIETTNNGDAPTAEDGLIIPQQADIAADAEQITVTIDRSYSAVPLEDLRLKGVVNSGKAKITLPEFDKSDFFSHISGYTWGFTSDPNGEKIEYYGGQTYDFSADTRLYRVLVKYGGGSGTKDDPYRIDYYDQLELMGEEKARGYFKQTADIYFPDWAEHTPINTVNELKADPKSEYFEYDGGGYVIENLTAPLFDTVSGAVIKNVNIRSSAIRSDVYRDYGFIVCNALNYHYEAEDGTVYETGETLIQHCSVSHSSIMAELPESEGEAVTTTIAVVEAPPVTAPDMIEYDEEGNPIETTPTTPVVIEPTKHAEYAIGAISGNGGEISDCYVTDFGIYANLPDYFLYAGGISGKPANVHDSVVYYFVARGNIFNAGGIAGSAAGARAYDTKGRELPNCYGGSIQGCVARNLILKSELAAGGVVAEGSSDAKGAMISNCYANEFDFSCGEFEDAERKNPIKLGVTGGIIATDSTGLYGHLVTATVSLADVPVIGKASSSEFDDTVRLAPAYAFYQENILTVINRNTVDKLNPKEIFTGSFMFGEQGEFGDETGSLAYPQSVKDLFEKTAITEQ